MAIYSSVPPPSQQAPSTIPITPLTPAAIPSANITSGLATLAISPSAKGYDGAGLKNPRDEAAEVAKAVRARREPLRRDSMKRREALLKGKEGSRRRQRWENDTFMHVPNAQPPLPSDWEVHPTYPVHSVPYYLAPLWDLRTEANANANAKAKAARKSSSSSATGAGRDGRRGRVPQELKAKLKRSKGAKTLLQELEEEVRTFVRDQERRERFRFGGGGGGEQADADGDGDGEVEVEVDSEDEDIVFIGRNGKMSDEVLKEREAAEKFLQREKKIWEGAADDKSSGFGRWLVHSIAAYYGLSSRSITVGDPARREAYVGFKSGDGKMRSGRRVAAPSAAAPAAAAVPSTFETDLPRPLYGLV